MLRSNFVFFSLLLSAPAFAGSQSLDCQTADKAVVIGAGNSTNRVQIKFVDKAGKVEWVKQK